MTGVRRLVAHLDVPSGPVELALTAGTVHRLPDDAAVVTALDDVQPDRRHRIVLDGRPLAGLGRARRVRAGLVVVGRTDLAADVNVQDHLAAVAGTRRADALLEQVPQLAARSAVPAGVLSGGERRLLGWLAAIAVGPRCLVLDRAGTGLDADRLVWVHRMIDELVAAGAVALVRVGRDEETGWVRATADGTRR